MLDNHEDGYVWQCGIHPAYAIWAKWWFTRGMDCGIPWHLSVCFCRRQKWGNPDLNEHKEHHLFYQNPVTTVDIFIRLREIQKSYSQSSDSFIWIWLNIGCPVYASGLSSFSMFSTSSCKWGFSTGLDTWIHFRWFNHHCQLVEPLNPNVDIGESGLVLMPKSPFKYQLFVGRWHYQWCFVFPHEL